MAIRPLNLMCNPGLLKLDRVGRDTRLILNVVAELEQRGVRLRSMTEEFDTATSIGRLMLTLLSGFAAD
jgi:DNA invertase Pin-like site-specific DNA recombinase